MDTQSKIILYLYYGYLPVADQNIDIGIDKLDINKKDKYKLLNENELVQKGVESLKNGFADCLKNIDDYQNRTHIVPISGGLDSRAILAGLIDLGLKDNIVTVTYGTPGTLDYYLGNLVAENADTEHISLDLSNININQQYLEWTYKSGARWNQLFTSYYNHLIPHKFGDGAVYWSGFMGDPLAGSHLQAQESSTWDLAVSEFAKRNQFSKNFDLLPPQFNPCDVLPQEPLYDTNLLTFDEQLDFTIRQHSYIRPAVMAEGYNYIAPFLNYNWINFILYVPYEYRYNEYIYKRILQEAYPDFFKLPVKNRMGLILDDSGWKLYYTYIYNKLKLLLTSSPKPNLNYIDFNKAIRDRPDIRNIVYNNIMDLKKRNVVDWLDIDDIWDMHQNKKKDLSNALLVLSSLEINLKLEENE